MYTIPYAFTQNEAEFKKNVMEHSFNLKIGSIFSTPPPPNGA